MRIIFIFRFCIVKMRPLQGAGIPLAYSSHSINGYTEHDEPGPGLCPGPDLFQINISGVHIF